MKTCTSCKEEKSLEDNFCKHSGREDGYNYRCKNCTSKTFSNWREKNLSTLSIKSKEKWEKEKGLNLNKYRKQRARKKWFNNNPTYRKEYNKDKYINDISFRLKSVLRSRLLLALKKESKVGSAVSDLGCTIQHLKLHIELFWDEEMSWENYGRKEGQWSIDHIKPLFYFDLTNREQLLEAVNFRNLQPLWHIDNMLKGIK
jgi:hypothetical protein